MRTVLRGGTYLRLADPTWTDPLDGRLAQAHGGRWNPAGAFAVVYLCASLEVARTNLFQKLAAHPYGPEDLDPATAPVLVETSVREDRFVDAVGARGLESIGLSSGYPRDRSGRRVSWKRCQPIGVAAWDAGHPGIACRSAAGAAGEGEELAWFQRGRRRLRGRGQRSFEEWFWSADT